MSQLHHKLLGIEIGGTKLQLVVADQFGAVEQTSRFTINPAEGAEAIRRQIQKGWDGLEHRNQIAATGVGFGGPVDRTTGTIRVSHQVAGWADFNLKAWLHELTGKPVMVENDANAAAMAEAVYGAGKEHERVFYMTIGSGIGGGMIINGDIYHGRVPGEVEIGHIRLNKGGDTLESCCSGWAVNKKVRGYIDQNPHCLLAQLSESKKVPEALLLQPALEQGDAAAMNIVAAVADDIAFALSHVVHLFHPDVLVIGGGMSLLQQHLQQPIMQQLPRYLLHAFLPPPPVLIAALGEGVVPVGALELARRSLPLKQIKTRLNS